MNSKQVNEYIRDNYRSMSDGELAAAISSMGFDITGEAVRKRRISMKLEKIGGGGSGSLTKEAHERLGRLNELLERSGIDPADIGEVKQIRVNEWQAMSKDEEGEPVITDLQGASIVLSPKWAEDPELPFVRPATPVKVTNPRRETKREQAGGTAFIFPDQQIPYHDERAWDKRRNKWKAVIGYEYRRIDIGRYDTEQEAALAYNEVAKKLHGSFAVLNQVQQH